MFWWLLFGGIVLFGALLYARLGLMLWRKGVALFQEVERATICLQEVTVSGADGSERAPAGAASGYDGGDGGGQRRQRGHRPVHPGRPGSGRRRGQN